MADEQLVVLGDWPRVAAQILRARLETAGIAVLIEWSGTGTETRGALSVPAADAEFASAVVTELEVDDEVPDTSPEAYLARIEEHLSAATGLLFELRSRLDDPEVP